MAKIVKLPSGNWRTLVYMGKDESGKGVSVSVTAPTKDEVIVRVAELKKRKKNSKASCLTVRDVVKKYIDMSEPVLSPTTIARYRKMLEYGFPELMDEPLMKLTQEKCQKAINDECNRIGIRNGNKPLSPKTIQNEWVLVAAALKERNFYFNVKLPKKPRVVEELPDPALVYNAIKGTSIELPCMLAMRCGMRMSEIRGLTQDSIHGDKLYIDKVLVDVNGVSTLKRLTKTDTSARIVPIPPEIKPLIPRDTDYLVPMTHDTIYKRFKRIMKSAGLDLTFHDLRHMYVSISLNILSIPATITEKSAGFSANSPIMRNTYSQPFKQAQDAAEKKLSDYFANL